MGSICTRTFVEKYSVGNLPLGRHTFVEDQSNTLCELTLSRKKTNEFKSSLFNQNYVKTFFFDFLYNRHLCDKQLYQKFCKLPNFLRCFVY